MRQAITCSAAGGERVQRICSSTKSVPCDVGLIPACNCNTQGGTGRASTQTVTRCARHCYTRTDLPSVIHAFHFARCPGCMLASPQGTERKEKSRTALTDILCPASRALDRTRPPLCIASTFSMHVHALTSSIEDIQGPQPVSKLVSLDTAMDLNVVFGCCAQYVFRSSHNYRRIPGGDPAQGFRGDRTRSP